MTIPASLAAQVRRVAKERHLTMSRALVILAERGVRTELDNQERLRAAHQQFMDKPDPARRSEAGKDLVRTIFGAEAIAEDAVL